MNLGVQTSEMMCEQSVEVTTPQVSKQFVAPFVAPRLLVLEENVERANEVPHEQMSEEMCEPIVGFLCPQVLVEWASASF